MYPEFQIVRESADSWAGTGISEEMERTKSIVKAEVTKKATLAMDVHTQRRALPTFQSQSIFEDSDHSSDSKAMLGANASHLEGKSEFRGSDTLSISSNDNDRFLRSSSSKSSPRLTSVANSPPLGNSSSKLSWSDKDSDSMSAEPFDFPSSKAPPSSSSSEFASSRRTAMSHSQSQRHHSLSTCDVFSWLSSFQETLSNTNNILSSSSQIDSASSHFTQQLKSSSDLPTHSISAAASSDFQRLRSLSSTVPTTSDLGTASVTSRDHLFSLPRSSPQILEQRETISSDSGDVEPDLMKSYDSTIGDSIIAEIEALSSAWTEKQKNESFSQPSAAVIQPIPPESPRPSPSAISYFTKSDNLNKGSSDAILTSAYSRVSENSSGEIIRTRSSSISAASAPLPSSSSSSSSWPSPNTLSSANVQSDLVGNRTLGDSNSHSQPSRPQSMLRSSDILSSSLRTAESIELNLETPLSSVNESWLQRRPESPRSRSPSPLRSFSVGSAHHSSLSLSPLPSLPTSLANISDRKSSSSTQHQLVNAEDREMRLSTATPATPSESSRVLSLAKSTSVSLSRLPIEELIARTAASSYLSDSSSLDVDLLLGRHTADFHENISEDRNIPLVIHVPPRNAFRDQAGQQIVGRSFGAVCRFPCRRCGRIRPRRRIEATQYYDRYLE